MKKNERLNSLLTKNSHNKTKDVLGAFIKSDEIEKQSEETEKPYEGKRVKKVTKKQKEEYKETTKKILQKPQNRNLSQQTQDILFKETSEYIPMESDQKQGIPNQLKTKFFTIEEEKKVKEQLSKLIRKSESIDVKNPDNSLMLSLLNPIYRNIQGTRDYAESFITVNFSIGNEKFKAEVNRFTGYIKDSTITIDSLYQCVKLVQDENAQTSELDICVNSKTRDELSKKRVLFEVEKEIENSRLSDANKEKAIQNLYSLIKKSDNIKTSEIKEARKNDKIKAYEVEKESKNPQENKMIQLVYDLIDSSKNKELTLEEQDILNKCLNTMYHNVNGKNTVKNNMVGLDFEFAGKPYNIDVNTYTGYINGTEHKIETFYKILKVFGVQIDSDVQEIQGCVNQKRVDEYIKQRILTVVKFRVFSNGNLDEAQKQELLDNLKTLENWVDIEKNTELKLAKDKNRISKSVGLTEEQNELEVATILKREFNQDNKERIASGSQQQNIVDPIEVKATIVVMQEEVYKKQVEVEIKKVEPQDDKLSELIEKELSNAIETIDEEMVEVVNGLEQNLTSKKQEHINERRLSKQLEEEKNDKYEDLRFKEMIESQIAKDAKQEEKQHEIVMEVPVAKGKITQFDFKGMQNADIKRLYNEGRIVKVEDQDIEEIVEVIEVIEER